MNADIYKFDCIYTLSHLISNISLKLYCVCGVCMFTCVCVHVHMCSYVCGVEARGWSDAVTSQKYAEPPEMGRNQKKSFPEIFRKKPNL